MKKLILVCVGAFLLGACSSDDSSDKSNEKETESKTPTVGTSEDIARADSLWVEIQDFTSWTRLDDATGFVPGAMPHGSFNRIYENDVAAADSAALINGSIIVKENFGKESEDALGAITVMKRIDGYSPDAGDWFFAKYLPDGNLDQNEAGVALAGAIGLGGEQGCIPCHSAASGDDFVFKN